MEELREKMVDENLLGFLPDTWEQITLGETCARGGGDIQTGPFGSQLHAADYVPHRLCHRALVITG